MAVAAPLLILLAVALLLSSCNKEDSKLLQALIRLSPSRYENEMPSEEKIAQWEKDVAKYEKIVQEKIDAAGQAASYYKLIGEEYAKLSMYGLALDNYKKDLDYEPNNYIVLYEAGVAASQYGLSRGSQSEAQPYLAEALRYHLRAIEINPGYSDPYLAAGVLYFYELDDSESAKEILGRGVELFPHKSSRMLFVLAQIAVVEHRIEDAIEIYDRIAGSTRNPEEKKSAISNREALLSSQ